MSLLLASVDSTTTDRTHRVILTLTDGQSFSVPACRVLIALGLLDTHPTDPLVAEAIRLSAEPPLCQQCTDRYASDVDGLHCSVCRAGLDDPHGGGE